MPEDPDHSEHWRWIEHRGKRILELDLRGCSSEEAARRQRSASRLIATLPERSVFCLTLAAGVHYDPRHMRELTSQMKANEPYVAASVIVGLDHLTKLVNVLNRLSGRRVRAFDDVEEAMDWLTRTAPED